MSQNKLVAQIMKDLATPRGDAIKAGMGTSLHKGQLELIGEIYNPVKDIVFGACGRKFGKTTSACYVAWRHALLNPSSAIYIVCPERAHGQKLYWDKQTLQRFLGKDSEKYLDGKPNNRDLMLKFKNGSFIQIIGSENWAAANGLTPDIVIYDEFKVFHPQFHVEMDPNRAAKAAKLFIIGTQPKVGDRNKEQYEGILRYAKENPDHCSVVIKTTWDNPINQLEKQKKSIERQIAVLRSRGEEDVVQREYYSRIVAGGSKAVLPQFIRDIHVKPSSIIKEKILNMQSRLEMHNLIDPASTSCYASLIIGFHPYSKKIYVAKEIFERSQKNTVASIIVPKIKSQMVEVAPKVPTDEWYLTCDEAAQGVMTEISAQFPDMVYAPTDKFHNKKETGLDMLKDIFLHNMIEISDECVDLIKEIEEYARDSKGNIPKGNDHGIDLLRYFLGAASYSIVEMLEAKRTITDFDEIEKDRYRNVDYDYYKNLDDSDDFDDWYY